LGTLEVRRNHLRAPMERRERYSPCAWLEPNATGGCRQPLRLVRQESGRVVWMSKRWAAAIEARGLAIFEKEPVAHRLQSRLLKITANGKSSLLIWHVFLRRTERAVR